MAEAAKLRPQTPPPPSRRGLPAIALPDERDDSGVGWLRRLAGHAYTTAEGLRAKALAIGADADLSDQGRAKAVSRHVAGEISRFRRRIDQETRRIAVEREHLNERVARRVADAAGKLSESALAEWRSALRALAPEQRSQVLRDAAAGRGAGADAIMAAATTAASPILLGLAPNDPLYSVTVAVHRERLAAAELDELRALDQAVADAEQAAAWLEGYVVDALVPEHELRDAQAAAQGGKPLASLTPAEKAARVAAGVERGDADLRDSLYTPATPTEGALDAARAPTAADAARFAALPLADRIAAGERGAGKSPAEIVAGASRAAAASNPAEE